VKPRSACAASLLAATFLVVPGLIAQYVQQAATEAQLTATAERGRALAEYDQAAWHATDAVQTANPKTTDGQVYIAKKAGGKWTVAFGVLTADKSKFQVEYEAQQLAQPKEFAVKNNDPPREDEGFYLFAARAIELALAEFGKANRPYNAAVLPVTAADGKEQPGLLYVYFYPAQTKAGIYPLGGDLRYLVSADGTEIIEKRQMHKTLLEVTPVKGKKQVAGFHSHTLSDVPEDTDVLHVLQQDPPVPEMIVTPHFVYEVTGDGTIRVKKQKK